MKHTYIAPKATAVQLHIESSILDASAPRAYDTVSNGAQLSEEKGWSSESWTETEE